eukprot:489565_1
MMETYCGTKRTDEEDKIDHVENVHNALNSISLGSTHETNQDDNANVDNDESSDSYDSFYYLMVSLEAASLIKTLAIPGALLHIICEYGEGHIMECWECKKQDHVDDIEESLDASEDWIEPAYLFQIICMDCYEELVYDFCMTGYTDNNYKCEE